MNAGNVDVGTDWTWWHAPKDEDHARVMHQKMLFVLCMFYGFYTL